jgi:alpha-tubulin suppressor-like RCC1 family protein
VPAPPPGIAATYVATITSPTGRATFSATLRGALAGTPNCTLRSSAPQPIVPGTTFELTAACSPDADTFQWNVPEFLGYMSIVGARDERTLKLRFNAAQPGQIMPVYLTPSNAVGRGPFASFLATAGNPNAVLPLNAPLVSAGGRHTCSLTTAGGAKCWGDDVGGQLGDYGSAVFFSTTPVNVLGSASQVASITSGAAHSCSLGTGGGVRCWGNNSFGQIGDDTATSSSFQVDVAGLTSGVASVSTGPASNHTCAVMQNGALKCWGRNDFGQLGTGLRFNAFAPLGVVGLSSGVARVALGGSHTCAVMNSGAAQCWGANAQGQLGDGSTSDHLTPGNVAGLSSGVASIVAGSAHSCALMTNRTVKCWGANFFGETGGGVPGVSVPVPTEVAGLSNVVALTAGGSHTCALLASGALKCWGRNSEGQLGDGTVTNRGTPVNVAAMTSGVLFASGGAFHTCAIISGGGAVCWGLNGSGRLGDGTVASRSSAQLVLGTLGAGFLDLTLEDSFVPPADKVPVFPLVASGTSSDLTANIQFRPQDIGTLGNVYVFALAPSDRVKRSELKDAHIGVSATGTPKDGPVACVLAQLNAAGQLQAVSASSLQAYARGVFTSAGQAVSVVNGIPIAQNGASFFVGYGQDPGSMLANGTNRSVAGPGDPGVLSCQPQAPQTGWWWNPLEGGRGFSIEAQGNRLFFAVFHYDASGRASWNVSPGTTSLDGAYFSSDLYAVTGGQTLGGTYRAPNSVKAGPITIAFNDASHGTMIWPGGVVPIERMNLVPGGLAAAPQANVPESGWWWNPLESGRGFFIEWQKGFADLAGYMYDDAGNPVWFISVYETPNAQAFSGAWWQYANGQSMGGTYRAPTQISNNVAPVTIQFLSATTATMTLPNGRTTSLVRQRF